MQNVGYAPPTGAARSPAGTLAVPTARERPCKRLGYLPLAEAAQE